MQAAITHTFASETLGAKFPAHLVSNGEALGIPTGLPFVVFVYMGETRFVAEIPLGYCVALTQIGRARATLLKIATSQTGCLRRDKNVARARPIWVRAT